jgi:branched-chain amino acid aminotransferase
MKTIERPVRADELGDFVECGLCGTAAVISPVGTIEKPGSGEVYSFRTGEPDSRIDALRKTLLAIQHNEIPAPDGWIMKIE